MADDQIPDVPDQPATPEPTSPLQDGLIFDPDFPEILPSPDSRPPGMTDAQAVEFAKAAASSMQKWAGEPGDGGGLGGSAATNPRDENYDAHKKPSPFSEVGSAGLAQYGGFVRDEFLPQLQGDKGLKTYREMYDNDAVIGALVFAIQMLLRKVEWRVEPPEAGTVEDIVNERFAERAAAINEHMAAQQQKLMVAQAGLATNAQGSNPRGTGPGGQPAPGQAPPAGPKPGMATGMLGQPPALHKPLGTDQPQAQRPDAQSAALAGQNGLPGGAGNGAAVNQPKGGPLTKAIRRMFGIGLFAKAASGGSGGGMIGGISALPPGSPPNDPETNEPMEFPTDAGLDSISPEARKAEELAVFVETCFHDMADSWSDTLAQIITMIVFGFSIHEIVYKKRLGPNVDQPDQGSRFNDGRVGWAKLAGRAQETRHRWEFDDNGGVIGMWQLAPPKFRLRYIPLAKALLFRTTAYKGNPEGRSVLRSAYRSWHIKRRVEEHEAIGIERNLAGLPVAYVPYEMMTAYATSDQRAALEEIKRIVRNLRYNEQGGVVFPNAYDENGNKQYELILLSPTSTSRSVETDKVITRYEQRMAMTALADVILLGHEAVGARSLGETKADLFTTALEAWLNAIADVINTSAIPRLMVMNAEDPAMSPKLTFGKLGRISLTEVAAIITALAGAGADLFPDTQLEDFVREIAGFPPKASSADL